MIAGGRLSRSENQLGFGSCDAQFTRAGEYALEHLQGPPARRLILPARARELQIQSDRPAARAANPALAGRNGFAGGKPWKRIAMKYTNGLRAQMVLFGWSQSHL